MRRLGVYAAKRLLFIPIAVFIVVTLSFGIVNLVPSDPVSEIAGGLATEQDAAEIRARLGLDDPLGERYVDYVSGLAHGDLGRSFYSSRPVVDDLRQYLPNTLELVVLSLAVAVALGLALGIVAAYFRDRAPDRIARGVITTTQSIPDFFLGLLLIYVVFFTLGWAPAPIGRLDVLDAPPEHVTGALIFDSLITGQWQTFWSALHHAMLPVLTLAIFYSAYFAKTTRSAVATALGSHQVEFARACGLPERQVLGYALRDARTPILTYGAILFAALIGGVAIIETIFAWRGIGQWALTAILKLDIPAVQGFILVASLSTLLIYLVLDLLVGFLDPRVSYDG